MDKTALFHSAAAACAALLLAALPRPAFAASPPSPPDFAPSGMVGWVAVGTEFLPPPSGPGPVMNDPAHPRVSNAEAAATGKQPTFHIGDPESPILQPWAKDLVRQRKEFILAGNPGYTRHAACWPMGVPAFLLYPVQPIYFVQSAKEVVMISQQDHALRHIYLNVPHSRRVSLSFNGESVGHYEGDTLVVDTIGLNNQTFVDNYRTPHTDQLHVVERFRLIDGGKMLEVNVRVEDPGAFTSPWNAVQRYRRAEGAAIGESFCAEGNFNYFDYNVEPVPQAAKPDF